MARPEAPAPTPLREWIRRTRKDLGLNRYDISTALHCRETAVGLVETGPAPMWDLTEAYVRFLVRRVGPNWLEEAMKAEMTPIGKASGVGWVIDGPPTPRQAVTVDRMLWAMQQKAEAEPRWRHEPGRAGKIADMYDESTPAPDSLGDAADVAQPGRATVPSTTGDIRSNIVHIAAFMKRRGLSTTLTRVAGAASPDQR